MNEVPENIAVVFDLDGTLIDSVPDVCAAVNRVLESRRRPPLGIDRVRAMVGDGARVMLDLAFAGCGDPLPADAIDGVVAQYLEFYKQEPVKRTIVYPGVRRVLKSLADRGVPMGVCTNKPYVMSTIVLEKLDLAPFFCGVTGGDNVPHRKPDGRHITLTLDLMGADPAVAVMVGDNETDVAAARDAGLPVVAVSYGYARVPPEQLGADALIGHFDLVPETLACIIAQRIP